MKHFQKSNDCTNYVDEENNEFNLYHSQETDRVFRYSNRSFAQDKEYDDRPQRGFFNNNNDIDCNAVLAAEAKYIGLIGKEIFLSVIERRFPIEKARIRHTPPLTQNALDLLINVSADSDRHSLTDNKNNDFKTVNSSPSRVLPNSCVGSTNDVFSASLEKTIEKPTV